MNETRIKATSEEATKWAEENRSTGVVTPCIILSMLIALTPAMTPNFISEIFYLCNTMAHYGYLKTIQTYEDFGKHLDELQRHHDMIEGDRAWVGVSSSSGLCYFPVPTERQTPFQARTEAALNQCKVNGLG